MSLRCYNSDSTVTLNVFNKMKQNTSSDITMPIAQFSLSHSAYSESSISGCDSRNYFRLASTNLTSQSASTSVHKQRSYELETLNSAAYQ